MADKRSDADTSPEGMSGKAPRSTRLAAAFMKLYMNSGYEVKLYRMEKGGLDDMEIILPGDDSQRVRMSVGRESIEAKYENQLGETPARSVNLADPEGKQKLDRYVAEWLPLSGDQAGASGSLKPVEPEPMG